MMRLQVAAGAGGGGGCYSIQQLKHKYILFKCWL